MRDTIRLYDVFDDDHVERDDEAVTLLDRKGFDDNHGAMDALGDYLCDVRGDTNRLSREAGAEDRDHLLACALTTLAQSLPGFNGMGSDEAREVIVPVIHGWLNKSEVPWLPYTAGLLPPGAVFKLHPDDLTELDYDPNVDPTTLGFCDDDEVYVQGDPWVGKDRDEETPPPAVDGSIAEQLEVWASDLSSIGAFGSLVPGVIAGMREVAKDLRRRETGGECVVDSPAPHHIVGTPRDPQLDRAWGRLPVTVAAGGGACGDTIRMVYEGLCGLSALIEWREGDRVVRHPVLIETFVQLDDLSPVLVGEMLYDVNYEPTGTKVFLRFSAIRSVEVS